MEKKIITNRKLEEQPVLNERHLFFFPNPQGQVSAWILTGKVSNTIESVTGGTGFITILMWFRKLTRLYGLCTLHMILQPDCLHVMAGLKDRTRIQPKQKRQATQLCKHHRTAPVSNEVSLTANPDVSYFRVSSEIF